MENLQQTSWITSCKAGEFCWLINGTISVLHDPANRHCADVLAWIAEGNTPAPEFTDAEIAANEPTYREKRVAEYPPIPEQLDMIYWDKVNGNDVWLRTIEAVKAKFPKKEVKA